MAARTIDDARLVELRMTLGTAKLDRLLRMLAIELERRPDALREKADAGDLAEVRSLAHSLKGAVASFGVVGVAKAARAVELASAGAELDVALNRLDVEARMAVCLLDDMLHDDPPTSALPASSGAFAALSD
jgi:HPt (histidine-containing phosphotransfer) domain-containing protein